MGLLTEAKNEQAAAKIGAFGGQGSGKTTTMSQIAIGLSLTFHKGASVAFFDTEKGSDFSRVMFEMEGVKLVRVKSRALKDLLAVVKEAEQAGCCALIVDSMTHVWNDLMDSFCARKRINRIEFQHWREIKGTWREWTDAMLNTRLHTLIAGRAGQVYEYQDNEDGKRELVTTGTKMKAEGDFGYEPDFLFEMWIERENANQKGSRLIHKAIVLKDRSMSVNGHEFAWPDRDAGYKKGDWKLVYQKFEPYLKFLNTTGPQVGIDATRNSQDMFDDQGKAEWSRRDRDRKIALEEFEATMVKLWPGSDAKSKSIKSAVVENLFATRSWTKVESLPLETVSDALKNLRLFEETGAHANFTAPEEVIGALNQIKEARKAVPIQPEVKAPEVVNGDKVISVEQLDKLMNDAFVSGWEPADFHAALLKKCGTADASTLKVSQLDAALTLANGGA